MTCVSANCSSCISFNHSGGGGNCDPCKDLGGAISSCAITCNQKDNLFHSIGPKLSRKGHEDYRCIYLKNTSTQFTLRNSRIYLAGPASRSTYSALGVLLQDEIQQVVVSGSAPFFEGEYFELQVPLYSASFQVYYSPNITQWQGNFQTAMRGVPGLQDVIIEADGIVPNVTFTINYLKSCGNRFIDLITLNTNTLSGGTVTPTPVQNGSPVNTTAITIFSETSPPLGIDFDYYYRGNPIMAGDLMPNDYIPLWIRRTLPSPAPAYGPLAVSGQMAKILDNCQIGIDATFP